MNWKSAACVVSLLIFAAGPLHAQTVEVWTGGGIEVTSIGAIETEVVDARGEIQVDGDLNVRGGLRLSPDTRFGTESKISFGGALVGDPSLVLSAGELNGRARRSQGLPGLGRCRDESRAPGGFVAGSFASERPETELRSPDLPAFHSIRSLPASAASRGPAARNRGPPPVETPHHVLTL